MHLHRDTNLRLLQGTFKRLRFKTNLWNAGISFFWTWKHPESNTTMNMKETTHRRHTHSTLSSSDIEVISEAERFLKEIWESNTWIISNIYKYLEGVRDDTGVLGTVMRLLMQTWKCAYLKQDDTYPLRGGVCGNSSSSMDIALNKRCYQHHEACHNNMIITRLLVLLTLTTLLASSSLDISILM